MAELEDRMNRALGAFVRKHQVQFDLLSPKKGQDAQLRTLIYAAMLEGCELGFEVSNAIHGMRCQR